MPKGLKIAAVLSRLYLGAARSFSLLVSAFVAVVLWANATRHDGSFPLAVLGGLILASGVIGFAAALFGYRLTRGQTFNDPEWRMGSWIYAGALLAGCVALAAIRWAFPEMPE